MLDIKLLRENFDGVKKNVESRQRECSSIKKFKEIDGEWRNNVTKLQTLNTQKNKLSDEIGDLYKKNKTDAANKLKKQVQTIKEEIDTLQGKVNILEDALKDIMFTIPNLLDKSVPIGKDEDDNIEIKKHLKPTKFNFKPLPHWELGVNLGLIDFERGIKISGARMYCMIGDGARLMRALKNFTLDLHISDGYNEVNPPLLINENIIYGLGKKGFTTEMYQTLEGQYLSATEEFPITGMYANEVIDNINLPLRLTGGSNSWRKEAGSAGKDVRGILRVHQFNNTELINICEPKDSWKLLEEMTNQAEKVLKELDIPYRIVTLCSGDIGLAASKTYDIEVWTPSNETYREVSSCSNCLDYQARGLGIKYKNNKTKEISFVHTLNGTGVSLNRLWIAIVENYQQENGDVLIPKALIKYMNGQKVITKKS